jgi:DNA-binding transcriptional MerR regulator
VTNDDDRLTAKEVANILGFTTTNLKHYAALLEQNGLQLYRNTRNHREYSQMDVNILRAMQHLNREKSMPLEEAASFVMSSDIDVNAILAPELSQVVATTDANIPVVSQVGGSAERVLAHLSALMADNKSLREELHARDKLALDFQSDISDKMEQQAKIIAEQSATIEAIRIELESIRKVAEEKPSVWSRLFGR